jgi:hypothetical protein
MKNVHLPLQGENRLFRTVEDRNRPTATSSRTMVGASPYRTTAMGLFAERMAPVYRQGDIGVEHGGEDIRAPVGHAWPLAGEICPVNLVTGQYMAEDERIFVNLVEVAHVEGIVQLNDPRIGYSANFL